MNKEEIYDDQINPLMAQIIKICSANRIAMLATFSIPTEEDEGLCCTTHLPDETGELPPRIAKCVEASKANQRSATVMLTTEHADGSKTLTAFLG